MKAWKSGHKKECKKLKSEQKQKKATDKKDCDIRQSRANLPPLDVNLDPNELWREGVTMSKSGMCEDAAWKFLLALFMDAALDANDEALARDAGRCTSSLLFMGETNMHNIYFFCLVNTLSQNV